MKRFLIASFLVLCLATSAFAAELAGVTVPDTVLVGGKTIILNGMALREKFVFDVYVATLYVEQKSDTPATILAQDGPREMDMIFVRDVPAKKINAAWMEGLKDNMPAAKADLTTQFTQLCGMMRDVKNGESMKFIYVPEKGTDIIVGEKLMGTIPGKKFADAILATWIGPKPGPGMKFKAAILGK